MVEALPDGAALSIHDLHCYRGHSHIVQGVSLELHEGVLGLIGRNGMGKTTFAECVMGMLPARRGTVRMRGEVISGSRLHQKARRGLAIVPQGRRLFASLTVAEHLELLPKNRRQLGLEAVYELFPRLAERRKHRANELSGGEQQMLAISRALIPGPQVLIMDEPSEGLAPVVVDELARIIGRLAAQGMPILLIEQNLSLIERTATQPVNVMHNGVITETIDVARLADDEATRARVLGVSLETQE